VENRTIVEESLLILSDVLADMPSQDLVDDGLISDAAVPYFLAELLEDSRIDSDRDQLPRFNTKKSNRKGRKL
jgi:hypothetical protein